MEARDVQEKEIEETVEMTIRGMKMLSEKSTSGFL